MTDTGKQIIRGAAYLFIFSILASVAGYAIRFVLAKNMSVRDFGLFYAVFNFIIFFALFKDLGLGAALTKFVSEYNAKKQFDKIKSAFIYVLLMQLFSVILFSVVIFLIKDFLVENYFRDAGAGLILFLFLGWLFIQVFQDSIFFLFYGFQRFLLFSMRDFMKNFFPLIFILVFLFVGFDYKSPALAYLLGSVLILLIIVPFLLKDRNLFQQKTIRSFSLVKELFDFGFPVLLSSIGYLVIGQIDTLILTFFRSLEEVGIYNVVLPTSMLFLIFGKSLGRVFFPVSSEMWAKNMKDQIKKYVSLMYNYIFLLTLPFMLVLFIFSDLFLRFFFGESYIVGSTALKILLFGVLLFSLASINTSVLGGIGKPKPVTTIIVCGAILNLVLNLLLIPSFGMNGAAFTTTLSYILIFIWSTARLSKEVALDIPWLPWIKTIFAGAVFLVLTSILRAVTSLNPWVELILFSAISFIVYFVLILLLKVTTIKEFFALKDAALKK